MIISSKESVQFKGAISGLVVSLEDVVFVDAMFDFWLNTSIIPSYV